MTFIILEEKQCLELFYLTWPCHREMKIFWLLLSIHPSKIILILIKTYFSKKNPLEARIRNYVECLVWTKILLIRISGLSICIESFVILYSYSVMKYLKYLERVSWNSPTRKFFRWNCRSLKTIFWRTISLFTMIIWSRLKFQIVRT